MRFLLSPPSNEKNSWSSVQPMHPLLVFHWSSHRYRRRRILDSSYGSAHGYPDLGCHRASASGLIALIGRSPGWLVLFARSCGGGGSGCLTGPGGRDTRIRRRIPCPSRRPCSPYWLVLSSCCDRQWGTGGHLRKWGGLFAWQCLRGRGCRGGHAGRDRGRRIFWWSRIITRWGCQIFNTWLIIYPFSYRVESGERVVTSWGGDWGYCLLLTPLPTSSPIDLLRSSTILPLPAPPTLSPASHVSPARRLPGQLHSLPMAYDCAAIPLSLSLRYPSILHASTGSPHSSSAGQQRSLHCSGRVEGSSWSSEGSFPWLILGREGTSILLDGY